MYLPHRRPPSKRSCSNPRKSRLRRTKVTLLRGQVAAAVRARNRKAPKDRVRSGPRLPARLLGQARNWGGFVQGGGGGGRGESTNPREPPPPPPHPIHPALPPVLHACCFCKDMKGLKHAE